MYLDPLYGIKFNSNFQWSTTSRDVKDGKAEHISREPEQMKAFLPGSARRAYHQVHGETAAKLRQIFDATSRTRGVYFFDEFDAIGSHGGRPAKRWNDMTRQPGTFWPSASGRQRSTWTSAPK